MKRRNRKQQRRLRVLRKAMKQLRRSSLNHRKRRRSSPGRTGK